MEVKEVNDKIYFTKIPPLVEIISKLRGNEATNAYITAAINTYPELCNVKYAGLFKRYLFNGDFTGLQDEKIRELWTIMSPTFTEVMDEHVISHEEPDTQFILLIERLASYDAIAEILLGFVPEEAFPYFFERMSGEYTEEKLRVTADKINLILFSICSTLILRYKQKIGNLYHPGTTGEEMIKNIRASLTDLELNYEKRSDILRQMIKENDY